ncbi:MAG: hypothetical protein V8S97_00620 [Oscillospiraceae bacterium]
MGSQALSAVFRPVFLLFVLSQIQAAVIVAGGACWCSKSSAWSLPAVCHRGHHLPGVQRLIYSLTVSFGDVGKAIVVVAMRFILPGPA